MKNLEVFYIDELNCYYIIHNTILHKFPNFLDAKENSEDFYENL